MRFNDAGPRNEAEQLQAELAKFDIKLHIIDIGPGDDITKKARGSCL